MTQPTDDPKIDRAAITIADLSDPSDSVAYWRSRPIAERLSEVERLRQLNYGYDPNTERLQRVLEIAELKRNEEP